MTREEIISNLLNMKHSVKEDTIEDMTINEAIKALEQEPVMPVMYYPQVEGITPTVVEPCDAVSRQAVLDLAKFDGRENLGSIIHAFDVEQLPPVKPAEKVGQWISADVLDKIRDEFISLYPKNYAGELELGGVSCVFSLNKVLNIIDKYKASPTGAERSDKE